MKYRIIYRCGEFRVQEKFLCFWIDAKEYVGRYGCGYPITFKTIEAAKEYIKYQTELEAKRKTPWEVVE